MERAETQATALRVVKPILFGVAVAVAAAVLLTFLCSAVLALGIPDGWIPFFTHLSVLLGATIGGLTAGLKGKQRGLVTGLGTGIGLFLIHLLLTALFGDLSLSCLTYLAAEALGGILGGILGVNAR